MTEKILKTNVHIYFLVVYLAGILCSAVGPSLPINLLSAFSKDLGKDG